MPLLPLCSFLLRQKHVARSDGDLEPEYRRKPNRIWQRRAVGDDFVLDWRRHEMAYTANYGSGDYIGLSEVRFVGTAVPEPSTYAMALARIA